MSAFVVSDSTINAAVTWLQHTDRSRNFSFITMLPSYDLVKDPEAANRLACDMFQLNVDAVNARYNGGADPPLDFHYAEDFRFTEDYSAPNAVRAFKLLECWRYQCSEGDVPETPLYQLMDRIIGEIACEIVHATEAYDRAPWGH